MLGPVEVRRDGRLVPVPGGKTSELLVRLALEAGRVRARRPARRRPVGAAPSTTRRNTLQSKVARLRRALGDPSAIASGDGGYKLAVEPAAVDALAVLRDAAAAAQLLDAGDDRGAAELSAPALELYRGDVLPRRRRRLGRPAPGAARRGAHAARRDPALGRGCGSATSAT